MRHLETTEQVAYKDYFCDRCCESIRPGEIYSREVSMLSKLEKQSWNTNITISVKREHVHPACDFPEDPEEVKRNEEHSRYLSSIRVA